MINNNNKTLEFWQISDMLRYKIVVDVCRNEQTNGERETRDSAHDNSERSSSVPPYAATAYLNIIGTSV